MKSMKVLAYVLAVVMIVTVVDFSNNYVTNAAEPTSQSQEDVTGEVESTAPETTSKIEKETKKNTVKKITPAAVKELKVTSVTTDKVSFRWKASKNATSYLVYRSVEKKNGKMTKAKKIKKVKTTSFTDSKLSQGTKYKYTVYAYRVAGKYKTRSKAVKVVAVTKPSAVGKVEVIKKSTKSIAIRWAKNSKANRYDIYRATETKSGKMSSYKLIKSVSASHTTYDDSKLQSGKLYGYKVVAKRTSGSVNAFSSAKGVKDITNLNAPKKLKQKKASDNKIKLTWKKVQNATCYEVYRDGKLIKTTKKTKYTDKYDGEAATIQYSVKAVRKWHKKKFKSNAAEVDAYSGDVMDGTWVEVSIKKQMLYMYVHGKLYVKTPVVTGNAGALSTTKGHHHVLSKSSPSRLTGSYAGKSWDVTVNYWLGFTGDGQGIHDSTWRSAYGGSIYKGNGSHGCVNTPLGAMKKVYKKGYIGMPVIVH